MRHKLQEIIENPDIFLFKEALFVYPTAAQNMQQTAKSFPKQTFEYLIYSNILPLYIHLP